ALRYVRRHKSELPKVVAAGIGRMWGVFRPLQTADLDRRGINADRVGLVASYVLIPLAIWGLVLLGRRKEPMFPILVVAALVTITAALFYGAIRFRVPADVAIVACAAVALDTAWAKLRPAPRWARLTALSAPAPS